MTPSHLPSNAAMVAGKSAEPPERIRHFVHYEPHTGQIRHVYTVVTFHLAHAGADDHHWFHARKIAEKHNPDSAKLDKVLLEGEQPTPRHKIDPGTQKLVIA
jgi:hypothetical protein